MIFFTNYCIGKTILINEKNSVLLNQKVSLDVMSKLQYDIFKKSLLLKPNEPIYLVLDTPGGSVFTGIDFINSLKAIPNPIHTITLFAASMGYQIVQSLGTRYITKSGILMSHRASGGSSRGYIEEVSNFLSFINIVIKDMELTAAKRVGLTYDEYRKLIYDEFWILGHHAVDINHADEVINLKCSKSLINGYTEQKIDTMFGSITVWFSKCPLIRYPLKIFFNRKDNKDMKKKKVKEIKKYIKNKYKYLKNVK
jgi:ATP-dependent protease ClpP protease subunit